MLDNQHWRKLATMNKESYRQIYPQVTLLKLKPIAEELVQSIVSGVSDNRLKWSKKGYVQVLTGMIFPDGSAFKSTLVGRRRRLSHKIGEILSGYGWRKTSPGWYAPPVDID